MHKGIPDFEISNLTEILEITVDNMSKIGFLADYTSIDSNLQVKGMICLQMLRW